MNEDLIGNILWIGLVFIFLLFCFIQIKRYLIDKKTISSGSQFLEEDIYINFQNNVKKTAMEERFYQRNNEKDDDEGEDKDAPLLNQREID